MKIKLADILEVAEVAVLFDQYRVFYGKESDLNAAILFLSDRLINQQSILLIACDESGMLLGFAQLYPTFSSVSMRKKYILNDLFVRPDARKLGVGGALLDQAKVFAKASSAVALTLSTAKTNFAAQGLYKANAWKQDEDFLNFDFML
ncbi:GNAT family N-acetyltransferase [Iodobacter sp. CM08]|uniref:GNAT family N-acetyltransferase n=1 Tax=Iodobacter sp. CM08 TaxID=3085902 RepID=UPI002981C583|nr:GNAT family N-acetyltransferase [Iodobacter sp. CM08]MDW5415820.1 GNAT family N-acetyltransferase [Iodobacter sp. CM08]